MEMGLKEFYNRLLGISGIALDGYTENATETSLGATPEVTTVGECTKQYKRETCLCPLLLEVRWNFRVSSCAEIKGFLLKNRYSCFGVTGYFSKTRAVLYDIWLGIMKQHVD